MFSKTLAIGFALVIALGVMAQQPAGGRKGPGPGQGKVVGLLSIIIIDYKGGSTDTLTLKAKNRTITGLMAHAKLFRMQNGKRVLVPKSDYGKYLVPGAHIDIRGRLTTTKGIIAILIARLK